MAERSAAQKAATRRMIAANKARMRGGSGRRSPRPRAPSIHHSRRGSVHTTRVAKTAGAVAIAWGLTYPWTPSESTTRWGTVSSLTQKDVTGAISNLKESIPLIGKDTGHQTNRYAVGAGIATVVASEVVKKNFPGVQRALHKIALKFGRSKLALN